MTPESELCAIEIPTAELKHADGTTTDLECKLRTMPARTPSGKAKTLYVQQFPTRFSETLSRCMTKRIDDLPFKCAINIKTESKPRPMGPAEAVQLMPHVNEMLDEDVISEAEGEPLTMPLFPVA